MARLNSFHLAPKAWPDNGRAFLGGSEANHLTRVLRHKPGDTVRLFDGQGRWGLFEVITADRKSAELQPIEITIDPEPLSPLTLALGWNKSTRRDWLLEKSVEFQAGGLVFWQAVRSQGAIPGVPKDTWQERLIQAAKQCGSTWLPALGIMQGADDLISCAAGYDRRILLWEAGENIPLLTPEMLVPRPAPQGRTLAVIGPEGGLDEHEVQSLLRAGFQPATLGSSILRWETAALHCLSLGFHARQL